MHRIIVADHPGKWDIDIQDVSVISPSDYISNQVYAEQKKVKVINLCKSIHYQSEGYYISLLAEARNHKVVPTVSTLMDFKLPSLPRDDAQDFNIIIEEILDKHVQDNRLELNIYFGMCKNPGFSRIGKLLFNLYQLPVQKATFMKKEKWQLVSLKPVNIKDLDTAEIDNLSNAVKLFLGGKKLVYKNYSRKKYDLAILINPEEPNPPSDPKAIQKFIKAAERAGFNTELITRSDFGRVSQFDALFIRETTNVNHHTFRFARKAEYEGLAVIDDPNSILKCTNKVYLKELLDANNIPTPKSVILQKGQRNNRVDLDFPFVLKLPDGAFSTGVQKVTNHEELKEWLKKYFQKSDLVIAQEFMPTEFDWRVGVLGGKVLYICKYFMAKNHWQIIDWRSDSDKDRMGESASVLLEDAPQKLVNLVLKATRLIGDGLYGVDVKESKGRYYIIEINDNPNIDAGVEDDALGNKLYEEVIAHLLRKVLMY